MKIKQLIWRNGRAETPFGVYETIRGIAGGWWCRFNGSDLPTSRTKKAAQAAAQADFERRAMACFEGATHGEN